MMTAFAATPSRGSTETGFLPAGVELHEFKPFAFFDEHMDCIRVVTLDRSVTEQRIDDFLTLYKTNHPSHFDPQVCGFCLKGIRHLFTELGIAAGAELRLADLIDRIVKARPQSTIAKILGEFPLDDLVIEWPEVAQAA
jgi:hypothetical protein